MNTQTDAILKHLIRHKRINPMQALNKFGCFRLAARIYDIRQLGYDVEKTMKIKNGKTFAEYKLRAN